VIRLSDGELSIRLTDERQKINPNRASDALLSALVETLGVERPLARRIGASTADWTDRDNDPRPLGAEREQYSSAGRSYWAPNLPFESLDEMQLVLGMTPEIYARVRPYVSLFSDAESPDIRTAPPIIQRALRLAPSRSAVDPEVTAEAGEVEDTAEQTADERAAAEEAEARAAAEDATAGNPVIAVEVIAHSSSGGVFVRQAVLRLNPASPKGYAVLDWRRGDSPTAP
jgi:general secretion pathway protein K